MTTPNATSTQQISVVATNEQGSLVNNDGISAIDRLFPNLQWEELDEQRNGGHLFQEQKTVINIPANVDPVKFLKRVTPFAYPVFHS